MTQILGTLKDSAGNGITGKLIVVLAGTLIDDATNPDTIYLPQSYTFTITAGALDITLPQSETSRITYNFQFFKIATDGSLIEPALINFNALVPNVSPVQFASLAPTGITNDVLDTGALRVARLISTTPALAQSIGGPFPQGAYNPTTTYKFRDLVTYLNRTYISKDLNPITGVAPTNTTSWMVIPVEPNGSLILADDSPYSSTWNSSGKAASQDAVYDQVEDVKSNVALKANLISPIFSGDVVVPNQTLGDASTKAANTNFVAAALSDSNTTTNTALALKAPLSSPTFTGDPKAPTPATTDNDTSIATTAYVKANLNNYATLASPTFTGSVVVPSQTTNDNSTKAANTNYVDTGLALKANIASPSFTGVPAVPTASVSNNTTQAASTAFVKNSFIISNASLSSGGITINAAESGLLNITIPLGSSTYRIAVIIGRIDFYTNGNNITLTGRIKDNITSTNIFSSTTSGNAAAYTDSDQLTLAYIHGGTFTGNYSFNINALATGATVFAMTVSASIQVLFIA
ncbi:hypothetical protein GTQ43_30505 [Nostoc sp. KVJ3]|uniref:hypothetical protein n=1 Tax=Nostoc sp. KVJ3 TaxID=457945 RepID=UPI00223886D4|nr:hypothetical protein [Nostoc sp. KVJ3]MCW5317945.1 hypothetical protein [Nostoc sp. KVJ3]